MSGNDRDGIDQATNFWLDRGGGDGDPTTQAWSDERDRVAADPDVDDWKGRDNEDREQAVVAAYDETKNRDADRSDWDAGRPHRDWVREKYPTAKLSNYITDKLAWNSYFQREPLAAEEAWTRMWLRQPPFRHQLKTTPKAEPPPDLHRDGLVEWEREQAVRDALATANVDRADADDYEATADLRALVKERTGLTLSQFLEKARMIDEGSLENPAGVAYRFATFSGAPVNEQHATEMVQAVQYQQASQAAGTWLDSLKAQNRLPADYDALENDIGDVLEFMNANGMRTGDLEADLGNAINWARDRVLARQQQANAENPPSMLDYSMRSAAPEIAAAVEKARRAAEKAKFASRSVTGSPSAGAGPARRRDPRMSYEDDLLADVRDAVRG